MALPGMRFGVISPEMLPAASPSELNIKADVKKRDEIREAFEVRGQAHSH